MNTKKDTIRNVANKKDFYVNIYKDDEGLYISDFEYKSYKDAYEERDNIGYVETVKLTRVK